MSFAAGSEAKNHSYHAVLWTKELFDGDIKIEYNYTRTDRVSQYTTLLYIQATGGVIAGISKDISEWDELREIPYMSTYFEKMNLIHISYAAYGKHQDGSYYVRARKYPMSESEGFHAMLISPAFDLEKYVNTGQTYHITAIKTEKQLFFKMESEEGNEIFT